MKYLILLLILTACTKEEYDTSKMPKTNYGKPYCWKGGWIQKGYSCEEFKK